MMPLGSIPDWFLNSIIGFDEGGSFQDHQPQEMRTLHPQQLHDYRSIHQGPSSSTNCGIPRSVVDYSSLLAAELEKQRMEMDWLLQVENQRLRTIVQEKSRQHGVAFQKYESKVMELISQKDRDLELARSRSMELKNILIRAQEENEALQKKAMESEALIFDLNTKLEQVREGNLTANFNNVHDGVVESYCESSNRAFREEEEEEEEEEDQEQVEQQLELIKKMGSCKQCEGGGRRRRSLNVVFLPCQHLCCCTTCEPLLPLCPVCQSLKGGSLEVFFD